MNRYPPHVNSIGEGILYVSFYDIVADMLQTKKMLKKSDENNMA